MLGGIQKRNRIIKEDIARTIESPPSDAGALGRLQAHADFYASLDDAIGLALTHLDKINDGQTPTPTKDTNHGE